MADVFIQKNTTEIHFIPIPESQMLEGIQTFIHQTNGQISLADFAWIAPFIPHTVLVTVPWLQLLHATAIMGTQLSSFF